MMSNLATNGRWSELSLTREYLKVVDHLDTTLRTLDAIHAAIAPREKMTPATADTRPAMTATALDIDAKLAPGTELRLRPR